MEKIVTFPTKTMTVVGPDGQPTGQTVNAFVHYLGVVLEGSPQKNDTDTFLAHEVREKIDALKPNSKMMTLTDSEITFIQSGVEYLRGRNAVVGSGWYFLLDPLRSAKVKPSGARG